MLDTWVIILIIAIACCVVGFPFTYIYWKQADKWAESERLRKNARNKHEDG